MEKDDVPTLNIPQFYAGRSVLITGASGFLGKVLVLRLLATCPDIGPLQLLIRSKHGQAPGERLAEIKQSPVFDGLRQTQPSQLDKLRSLEGDTAQPGLGLGPESLQQLENVSVVIHVAATVKFNMELKRALDLNTIATISLLDICERLPNVQVLVHVSTGYSNTERAVIEERVYPPSQPLSSLIASVQSSPQMTDEDTRKFIFPKPNTYTFTKWLAEAAVLQHGVRKYPIAVFRPTMVVSSVQHPEPGWVESHNGPAGVVVATSRGLLRVFQSEPRVRTDLLPVDMAVDTLIAVAWETYIDSPRRVRVYNCSTYERPTTVAQFHELIKSGIRRTPVLCASWYPNFAVIANRTVYKLHEFFKQTLPFYLMEYISRLFRPANTTSTNLIEMEQYLRRMNGTLTYFTTREWHFRTDNVQRLRARLSPADARLYNIDPNTIDWRKFYDSFVLGCRRHLTKESDDSIPRARRRMHRLYLLHVGLTVVIPALLVSHQLWFCNHHQRA